MVAVFVIGVSSGFYLNSTINNSTPTLINVNSTSTNTNSSSTSTNTNSSSTSTNTNSTNNSSSSNIPFDLNLVITGNNLFNSTVGDQPAFFVLVNGTLKSSADITVPANQSITLSIYNFDNGTCNMTSLNNVLTGTVSNEMFMIPESQTGTYVSSIPLNKFSFSFTVLNKLNSVMINIPIEPSSLITTTIMFPISGNFHWQCFVPRGFGPSGWGGAMETPGWLEGTVVVS